MAGEAPKARQPVATRRSARQSVLIKNDIENSKSSVQSSKKGTSINHVSDYVSTSEGRGVASNHGEKKAVPKRTSRTISGQVHEKAPGVVPEQNPLDFALQQVSTEELQNWDGWCVLESEPAFFNVILREVGVSGIKIQEVLGIEEGMLELLPNPIYGLIFLYQVNEGNDDDCEGEPMHSDSVWFANQIANDSCASVALMNVVMNADGARLGDELQSFKNFTKEKTPRERGEALSKFQLIRNIHNSFARKMDILSADLVLASEEAAAKSKRNGRKAKRKGEEISEEPGYHFIAFLPVDGCLWKLDGLQPQPINLGECVHLWMQDVQGILARLMEKCENDGIEFSLQAVCRSPLLSLPENLAINIANIKATEARLDGLLPEWKDFLPHEHELAFLEESLRTPNENFGLSAAMIDAAQPQDTVKLQLEDSSIGAHALMEIRKNLIGNQFSLRQSYIEEVVSMEEDAQSANGRRFDHTPFLAAWTQMLAGKGILKDLWNEASY